MAPTFPPRSLSLGPLRPLSPSPSPPSDDTVFDHIMLGNQQQLYSQQPFDYLLPPPTSDSPPPAPGSKRYRAAPPKAFQCAGYGDCRMVFSRSEHLARHIRKHTGERPFACHCTKQFSRLDNLRQHAQTVHSAPEDKPRNEAMMRALASVNASMMAGVRGRRRFAGASSASCPSTPADLTLSPHALHRSYSSSSSGMPSPSYPPYAHNQTYPNSPSHALFPGGPHPRQQSYPHHPHSAHTSPYPSPNASGYPPALLAGAEYHFSPDEYAGPGAGADGYFGAASAPSSSTSASTPAYPGSYGVRVKEEQREEMLMEDGERVLRERVRGEEELEGFYAALHGLGHGHDHGRGHGRKMEMPATMRRYKQQQQQAPVEAGYLSTPPSQYSSPAGSPCAPTFWPAHVSTSASLPPSLQQQGSAHGGPYLPSPPQSPAYSVSSSSTHSSSSVSSAHSTAEAQEAYHWQQQQQMSRQRGGEVREMSNAEYYAALQAQGAHQGAGAGTPLKGPGAGTEYFPTHVY